MLTTLITGTFTPAAASPEIAVLQDNLAITQTSVGQSAGQLDMSLWGLITHADAVVQAVMIILLIGSVYCWKIIFQKYGQLRFLRSQAAEFERIFWDGASLDALFDRVSRNPHDPFEEVFCAGMREWREEVGASRSRGQHLGVALQDRVERSMRLATEREVEAINSGLTYLANLASSAPFIGLFGTVWGIMSSFQAIAVHQNTNLTVVAPGIAEALFTTALGLFAAIPAAIFYNTISLAVKRYTLNLDAFVDEFLNIVSRQVETFSKAS